LKSGRADGWNLRGAEQRFALFFERSWGNLLFTLGMKDDPQKSSKLELTPEMVVLLTESQPRLLGFLVKRLGNLDQAHEVLQEVNIAICKRSSEFNFENESNFLAWAFTVARFQLMAFRTRQFRDRLVFPADLAAALDELDTTIHPSDQVAARETALSECLGVLTDRARDLVVRRYAESVSVTALAAEMEKTTNAVSLLLHRIRVQLMNCIEHRLRSSPH
jgi:RNA polymerase sigma-70 factor, ECF subfamily